MEWNPPRAEARGNKSLFSLFSLSLPLPLSPPGFLDLKALQEALGTRGKCSQRPGRERLGMEALIYGVSRRGLPLTKEAIWPAEVGASRTRDWGSLPLFADGEVGCSPSLKTPQVGVGGGVFKMQLDGVLWSPLGLQVPLPPLALLMGLVILQHLE